MGIFETRLEETFHKTVDVLEKRRLRFFLIGAIALGHRIVPQATQDIDIIVDPEPFGADDLFSRALRAKFTVDTSEYPIEDLRRFFKKGQFIRFHHGVHWIDLSVVTTGQDRRAMESATPLKVFGREVLVATVEDLLVYKLMRDLPKDVEDRHLIMSRWRPYLDFQYVEEGVRGTHDARAKRLWAVLKKEYRGRKPSHGRYP